MSDAAPDAISGFRGAILTKGGAEAHVYTDIEDAEATTIGGIYSKASGGPNAAESYTVSEMGGTTELPTIKWEDVKRADMSQIVTGTGDTQMTTFAGSVRGLLGTFSCTAANCAAPLRGIDGSVPADFAVTGWTFAPTNPNGRIDVADKDGYLQFGWWLNPKGRNVDDGFNVQIFASAPGMTASEELSGMDVEGSATYTGGAAGKWAIASTTEDRTDGGHFTATATIGVDFDADADDDATNGNDKNGVSVSGMITDFMTGDVSRPGWSVELIVDDVLDDANTPSTLGAQTAANLPVGVTGGATWSTGGAVDGTGTWEADFYGSEKVTTHPLAVAGTFQAAIAGGTVGRIRGAFGATK